ncbi:MAG: DNA polymerase III subunit gamma/tau [Acidimicrobiia bacterium]|nr:DNA polymerase III subunit gamma/tau [Acidimicrobiia bacterium]
MQYQALYRKYRPQRFDEVVGQDHVTTTIAREVVQGKVAHAYLLAGPRGTGKTTTARLLAKSLNCADRAENGEPDNTCDSCVAITEGTSLDVIELDAASNNKVEDVREIRVNAATVTATAGSHRIYILDEAHMLTRAAGNALLKILEEPPEHVIFVLATTEPYKLLDTIRSRAQRFDFQPVPTETLIDYLGTIAAKEGLTTDRAALEAVTAHAGGSVRDAMSLLEQVAALGAGTVSAGGVAQALGLADHEVYGRLVDVIAEGDAPGALELVAGLASTGADLRRFVADAIAYFRGLFLVQYTSNVEEVVDVSGETIAEWRRRAAMLSNTAVLRAIEGLSDALMKVREGREERLVVEIALIRLTRPETVADLDGVLARIDRLERRVEQAGSVAAPSKPPVTGPPDRPFVPSTETTPAEDPPSVTPQDTDRPTRESENAPSSDAASTAQRTDEPVPEPATTSGPSQVTIEDFRRVWPAVMADIRHEVGPRRQAFLREAAPAGVEGDVVVFEVAAHLHFHLENLKQDTGVAESIARGTEKHLGVPVGVAFRAADAPPMPDTTDRDPVPDKEDLVSAEDEEHDPVKNVTDVLGGEEVVE